MASLFGKGNKNINMIILIIIIVLGMYVIFKLAAPLAKTAKGQKEWRQQHNDELKEGLDILNEGSSSEEKDPADELMEQGGYKSREEFKLLE